ncbi:MAG: transcriptional repressor, partial [Bacteroidota bacterium]
MEKIYQTKPLRVLLETFEQSDGAISMADLIRRLKPHMNRTTVYRILQRLEKHGKLHSFRGKDGAKWYAKCQESLSGEKSDSHPHFQCKVCGKIECLNLDVSNLLGANYKIDPGDLLVLGQCK